MKNSKILLLIAITAIGSAAIFTACQKSAADTSSSGGISTQDAAALQTSAATDDESDNVYNDVLSNVLGVNDDAGIGAGVGVFLAAPASTGTPVSQFGEGADSAGRCFTVTVSPDRAGAFPKTITIDFGTGCTGRDGHVRRGKIITVYTGHMIESGSTATTTFDGFYFDSVKVEGTVVAKNKTTGNALAFSITVTNGKLTAPSGDYIEVNRSHTWAQTSGMDTPHTPADDIFSITGNSSGTAQVAGVTAQWITNITQPVVRKLLCRWRVAGVVTVTHNDKSAVLDYGNGDCDNTATVTIGSKTYNITLR
ncbi:MAG TPA: hypothetical protein VHB48_09335 [Chitinophagaceae bacterium]|nr:hypothetical protein [Chitinophagaceae bacterium]